LSTRDSSRPCSVAGRLSDFLAAAACPSIVFPDQDARRHQAADHLFDEQRVAAGPAGDRVAQPRNVGIVRPEHPVQEVLGLAHRQQREPERGLFGPHHGWRLPVGAMGEHDHQRTPG
jgi:hypothetical protein